MTIEIEERDGIKIVRLHGDLIGGSDSDFVERITDLLAARGTRVVLELRDVPFMNSIGLSELVRVTAQANTQECRVVLAAPAAFVAGVLQTTQLDRFFEICPTLDEALVKLR